MKSLGPFRFPVILPRMSMQYQRHRNGGGLIYAAELASVGSDCYICPDSRVEAASFVSYKSSLFSSAVRNSSIADSSIERSVVVESNIAGAYIGESALQGVVVRGTVDRKADLEDVMLTGVDVEGCKLRGFELHGPYLVHSDWDHEPRHHLLTMSNGIEVGLIECGNDRFHVGCACRPFSKWDKKESALRRYFLRSGWDLETFNSIRKFFESWR